MAVWTHSYIIAIMMGTEMVPEMLVGFNKLTRPIVSEDFIVVTNYYNITKQSSNATRHGGAWVRGGIAPTHS
jgi:hypothetical protein